MTKPAPVPTSRPIPVRLVTFNTHHGVGDDGRHDLPRLAQVLAAADADVHLPAGGRPALRRPQRGRRPGAAARPGAGHAAGVGAGDRRAAAAPGGRAASTATRCSRGCRSWSATCTGCPGGGEPRSALRTMVELDGGALWVTATHLSRSAATGPRRWPRVAALHTGPMETGVVVGDFNTGPDAPELAALRTRFADAWELAARARRPGRAGGSGSTTRGYTHPARSPHRRIDQAWVTHGVAVAAAQVLDGGGASDHLPLMVDLEVRSGV